MPTARYAPSSHGVRSASGAHPSHGSKTPHTKRRTSSALGGLADPGPLADPVPIEEFPPPTWRAPLNSRADLGYPDFYPSRPGFGQPEDELTEPYVKGGFALKPAVNVTAESFSMHGPVYQQLQSGGLEKLMELGQAIIRQRNEAMPSFQERAFRIPVRVTYNDTKRLQFLAELANPEIPLTRLMRTPVPHGFKGVELLETMYSPPQPAPRPGAPGAADPRPLADPIPIDRALWFIRVLGANEISAHRGRAQPVASTVQAPSPAAATPSSTATASPAVVPMNSNDWYTGEFTVAFTAWLRQQLGQLVLPTKTGKGTGPMPLKPLGVLGDENLRARWLAKWQYSNTLLRELYRKRLVSPRLLVKWYADALALVNFAQLGFVSQLIHESLADFIENVAVGRHCVRAACAKITEIRASPAKETMSKVESLLASIVRVLYDADAEVLLSPATWSKHAALLGELVGADSPTFKDLGRRNDALVFRPITVDSGTSPRRQQMAEIQKLDSICAETDMAALCKQFFAGPCAPTSPKIDMAKLEEKVFILVNWAMGLYQLGIHRPYAVYTMLKKWLKWYEESRPQEHFDFFPILYKWLDTSAAAQRVENVLAIGISFGELTRQGMFSYGRYLNALIARGHSARFHVGPPSHHLELLRAMPIFVLANDLMVQRRLVLSGESDAREKDQIEEDAALETFRQEIKEYVPECFGLKRYGRSAQIAESIDYQIPSAAGINRYEFVYTRFWLYAAALRHFKRQGNQPPMNASTYARVMNIFMQCRGYSTLCDFLVHGIGGTEDEEILHVILDCIKRDADCWTSIDRWKQLSTALLARFRLMESKGRFLPKLAAVLLMLGRHGRLPHEAEDEVHAAIEQHRAKSPPAPTFNVDMDQSMDGVKQIIAAGDVARGSALAPKLFNRHGKFSDWSETWWHTVVAAVQSPESAKKADVVGAALAHIGQVDEQAGDGSLRPVIAAWLETLSPSQRVDIFGRRNVPPLVRLLLLLVVARRIGSLGLLEKLVYPELKHAATLCTAANPRLSTKRTCAIDWTVTLMQQIVLCTGHKSLPPTNLREAFILRTSRSTVLHAVNVEGLIKILPVLVVLERTMLVPEKTRVQIGGIFRGLAALPQFKTAAFRNLDVLKDAFLSNDWIKRSTESSLETGMVEGLKLMMSDSTAGVKGSPTLQIERGGRYSAWRWTRVVLEMRVEFKRLTMRIANNDDAADARASLNRLVRSSLDREASTDDMDLLVEAFRGADSVVAQEILAVGLDRLGVLLQQLLSAEDQHHVEDTALAVDLVLRVIGSAGRQERLEPPTAAARDRLFSLLAVAFQSLERRVTSDDELQLPPGASPPDPGYVLQVALKLLRFALTIPTTEVPSPTAPKPDYGAFAIAFLHLAVALCARAQVNTADLNALRDLLVYLVDSVPSASQSSVHQALNFELSTPAVQDLLARYPAFACALPRPTAPVRAMALAGTPADGGDEHGVALDDRPWEMLEAMVTPSSAAHGVQFLATKGIKDTSSIPIALFAPQLTRDAVAESDGSIDPEVERPWEEKSSERNLGNGAAGEPVAARQAATVLYARDDATAHLEDAAAAAPSKPKSTAASRKRTATGARVPTSTKGAGTSAEPIAIDSDGSSSDGDIPLAEQPLSKRQRTGSKSGAASTKGTTAGKAPRKNAPAAKKAPAGKSVRSTSGKNVKGR